MSDASHSPAALTSKLLSSSQQLFEEATQSPFLVAAGDGTLSKAKLSEWLSQDRLYGQAYIGFIGSLLAQNRLPTNHIPISSYDGSVHWRIAHILQRCLSNIFRELKLFEDTAQKYGLDLEAPRAAEFVPVKATTEYIHLFQRFSCSIDENHGRESLNWVLLSGLIVLWASEKCYLEAWRFAASHVDPSIDLRSDADEGALREILIPNWTSPEFIDFVRQLEDLINELVDSTSSELTEDVQIQSEKLWQEVLDIERQFWPNLQ